MCMKYVNVISTLYDSISTVSGNIASFNAPLNQIEIKDVNNPEISNLTIVTDLNFLGTNDKSKIKDNVLINQDKVDIIIRLTKCDKNVQNRIGYDIDAFSIDFKKIEKEQLETACFDFYNHTRITEIGKIPLVGGTGNYVLKVLIKKSSEKDYSIQFMRKLAII